MKSILKHRILLDCTVTVRSGLKTGIQRVVNGILDNRDILSKQTDLEIVPICHQFDWFYTLEDALVMNADSYRNFTRFEPMASDIYFCIDSFWTYEHYKWFDYFKNTCHQFWIVAYDLIPLEYPHFFSNQTVELFKVAMDKALIYSDIIFCISNSTSESIEKYTNYQYSSKLKLFQISPATLLQKKTYNKLQANNDYYLMIGTLEPRRGYLEILIEFQQIWKEGYLFPLIIVGKKGEKSEDIIRMIDQLIYEGSPLQWFQNVEDDNLIALYQNCKAVIVGSIAEGYGLPLTEALQFQKVVFANKLPVFEEIAANLPIYFNIFQTGDLKLKILNNLMLKSPKHELNFISWEDSMKKLANEMVQIIK